MINICLAHTRHGALVERAAEAMGLRFAARQFSAADLMELREPTLLVFDEGGAFTPDFLQYLRRTHRGGVRYSPAVVFCPGRDKCNAWRDAGAVALYEKADLQELQAAMRLALLGERRWVTSATYVGPDRRQRAALFKLRKRRREDRNPARAAETEPAVSSLERLHRRISFAAQLLQGATIESRRAFQALIGELEASVSAHHRHDLAPLVETLKSEAERLLVDAEGDIATLEDAVMRLGDGVAPH